jgi:NitT/TauT family transport system substrate-binding protein
MELEGNIGKLSKTGEIRKEWMVRALEMAKLTGMTNLAPVEQTFVTDFKVSPTK